MGNLKTKQADIIIVGLDNSGKSTMINYLKPKKYAEVEIAATVGYSIETFTKSKINFTAMDMSGQGKYRSLWEKYYRQSEVGLSLCLISFPFDSRLSYSLSMPLTT